MKRYWLVIGLLGVALAAGLWIVRLYGENASLRQDVAEYQRQLQEQSDSFATSRQELLGQVSNLQGQFVEQSNQVAALSNQVDELREQVSPDYERLLQRAREEAAREQRAASGAGARAGAARAMAVDPETARAVAATRVPELYGDFVSDLELDDNVQEQVMSALVDLEAARSQMRGDLLAGNLASQQALDYFGSNAISANLDNLLSGEQLAELEQYNHFLNRDSARLIYGETLSRMGTALTGEAGDLALQTVLDQLYSEANNHNALVGPDGSMRTAYNNQLQAYDRAREQLQGQLDPEQANQLDRFLDSRRNGVDLVLEASVDESGGLRLRNERVAAENLPD